MTITVGCDDISCYEGNYPPAGSTSSTPRHPLLQPHRRVAVPPSRTAVTIGRQFGAQHVHGDNARPGIRLMNMKSRALYKERDLGL